MKRVALTCGLLLLLLPTYAQSIPAPNEPSIHHQALQSLKLHLESLPDSADHPRKHLIWNRWGSFWEGRLGLDMETGFSPTPLLQAYQSLGSTDADGWDWQYAGPGNLNTQNNGRVECAAVPSPDTTLQEILIGTPSGGIWRTSDGGANWHCTTDDDFTMPGIGCHSLVYHPSESDIVYAAIALATAAEVSLTGKELGYGLGIYTSGDGGESWSPTNFTFDPTERKMTTSILINPANGDQMYAAVNDQVFYTSDAWLSAALIFDGTTQSYDFREKVITDLEVQPGNFDKLWISTTGVESWTWLASPLAPGEFRYHAAELWTSNDATSGSSEWLQIQTPLHPTDYALVSNDPQPSRVLVSVLDADNPEDVFVGYKLFQGLAYLWRSQDSGNSWQQVLEVDLDNVDGYYQLEMEVSPKVPHQVYLAQRRIKRFDLNDPAADPEVLFGPHVDTRFLKIISPAASADDEEILLQGNDGGITKVLSQLGDLDWENLNGTGLGIQQLYGLAILPEPDARIVAGSQDNFAFRNSPSGWEAFLSGDRYDPIIHADGSGIVPVNPSAISEFLDVHASDWNAVSPDPSGNAYFNRPVAQDTQGGTYIGYSDIWYLATPNAEWENLSNLGYDKVRAIAVGNDPNRMAIGFSGATWDGPSEKKLLYTTNAHSDNPIWTDLTSAISESNASMGINALAFDPENEDRLIIGFEHFHNGQEERRVTELLYHPSTPNSPTVTLIGSGLPNVPVNDLLFVPGVPGRLLLGNDIGVFERTAEGWDMLNGDMPLVFVSDMEYDPFANKVWISTFGRGLWAAALPCEASQEYTLSTDETWNEAQLIEGWVIVPDGVTLTIQGSCHFQEDAGIRVLPGGRLEVSGWLTAACSDAFWHGIEAVGQPELPQHPEYQAVVDLTQGAIIEKARIGVLLGSPVEGCDDFANGGALLYADRTGWRNNVQGVAFAPYRNLNDLGYSIANKSSIARSSFKTTADLPGGAPFRAHVLLDNVNRVRFAGCSFQGISTGTGILSRNATFRLTGSCTSTPPDDMDCPAVDYIRNRFSGLKRGIDARSWLDTETFSVEASDFEHCNYGLRAIAVMNAKFRDCTIQVPPYEDNTTQAYYGMHWVGCSGYTIEGNQLFAEDPADENIGLIITDSEDDPNQVFGNDFHHLSYAILAQGDNRDHTPNPTSEWDPSAAHSGLQFLCNRFWQNDYDLSVTNDGMIAEYQGIPNPNSPFSVDPAYNEFNNTACPDANNLHINAGSDGYFYYYPEGNNLLIPDFGCFDEVEVWLQEVQPEWLPYDIYNYDEVCSTNPAPIDFPNDLIDWLEVLEEWELLDSSVKSAMDGGNSQELLAFITDPAHDEKALRVKLLPLSPWLSDPALLALLDRSLDLTDLGLYQILAANLPCSSVIWERLEEDQLLPDYWLDQLRAMPVSPDAFDCQKSHLGALRSHLSQAVADITQHQLVESDSSAIQYWLPQLLEDPWNSSKRLQQALGWKSGKPLMLPSDYISSNGDDFPAFMEWLTASDDPALPCMASESDKLGWRGGAAVTPWTKIEEVIILPQTKPKATWESLEADESCLASPNPAARHWTIQRTDVLNEVIWQLSELGGSIIRKGIWPSGLSTLDIPCNDLPAGAYHFRMGKDNQANVLQLIKI